ncbi:hypothetical protein J2Y83_000177 [Pseudomonas marginalis]|uniref:HD domain-containing protein n=1 Tax=Pseudomonas marginalis TaxID=298 RepID=UPI00209E91CC|nr:ATP-binding protein [Pseudomonas marginalis]MCP1510050.1 hypothetical protein [Pseudomonas marginalis]MCP1521708.1 hypothetical protein [Pseudomonas marginalis]MDQ0503138.1 hypothetical protein [Pseudomonas marginalis]
MNDLPQTVLSSQLYSNLSSDQELITSLISMRKVAESLASTISTSVPCFTDHSIKHMDALWLITDQVLTSTEIAQLSTGEAFLLATSFYLHDLGMAYAATEEGRAICIESGHYKAFMSSFTPENRAKDEIKAQALAYTVRKIHAPAAHELATNKIPGSEYYLFESKTLRDSWGATCGQISASHHWSIERLDIELGKTGTVPLPGGRSGDLGYVASILRIVDYAHINRERAPSIERAFKQPLPEDSLLHWLAQEQVDGPFRDGHELTYRSAVGISNVDSWWLYYEMLSGLDAEIRAVQRYLKKRPHSINRFSLQGVLGAASPEETSTYIKPNGFMPIEVNLKTGSIDRLVKLLAGESLYGNDPMAAIRELLQNANDAVRLKFHTAADEYDAQVEKLPIKVELFENAEGHFLSVSDFGVGMTKRIMTDYLISIASNYWDSQFHYDYPDALEKGFLQAGKFGIGFLSVFMLGDEIEVTSNKAGGEKTLLKLHGVGRRGEITNSSLTAKSGTTVKIKLKTTIVEKLNSIQRRVSSYAPMLKTPIKTITKDLEHLLEPGWLFKLDPESFKKTILQITADLGRHNSEAYYPHRRHTSSQLNDIWESSPPEYVSEKARLVAGAEGICVICLKGLSLQVAYTPGFIGIVELDDVTPDVSRRQALDIDLSGILKAAQNTIMDQLIKSLEKYTSNRLILNNLSLISSSIKTYGDQILLNSKINWLSRIILPGDISLCSTQMLFETLKANDTVFIAFDANPWEAMKLWTSKTQSVDGEAAFTLSNIGDGPGYRREIEYMRGTLSECWKNFSENTIFYFLIKCISFAWNVKPSDLAKQHDWRHEGSTVYGRLTKNKAEKPLYIDEPRQPH